MASEKTFQHKIFTPSDLELNNVLTCDICGSGDIVETIEGYSCRNCGVVLDTLKLEYHQPYNKDIMQYAVLGTTQIGSPRERAQLGNSPYINKLNKLNSIGNSKDSMSTLSKMEISRIFTALSLPEALKELVFKKSQEFYNALQPGTKFRNPEKLAPLAIYFCLKFRNISINESRLLEVSHISKKDFNAFKLQIVKFFPQYKTRNRKQYIIQRILEISEHYNLGMEFFYQAKKILYKLWESINNTKDDVIAGLVCSISALCSYRESVSVNAICMRLGIKMSTIQTQVKRKIFERFRISGFVSLVKSSDILKTIMGKLGLVDDESQEGSHIVEVKLGNAVQVFNSSENPELYMFAIKDNAGLPITISLQLFDPISKIDSPTKIGERRIQGVAKKKLGMEVAMFHTGKGPPLVPY